MALLMVVAMVAASVVGCATPSPRYVEGVDSSEDGVKFLYKYEAEPGQWERGVFECDIDDGQLDNCRRIEVEFR